MSVTIADVAPEPVLTEIAMEYGEGGGYVQDALLPTRTVARNEFKYMTWPFRDFIQGSQYDSRRAPGDTAKKVVTPKGTWDDGQVHERTLKDDLPDEVMANAANDAAYEAAIVRKITNALRLEIEIELEAEIMDDGTHSSAAASATWDHATDAAIEADIDAAKEAFLKQVGFEATHMVIPPATALVAKRDSDIRALRKATDDSLLLNGDLPPVMFGLRVVIPGAIEDTANPGQSASIARVWAQDNVSLIYVDPSASTDPTAMTAVMRFTSAANTGTDWTAYTWRDPDPSKKTNWYRVETFDDLIAVSDCIYIITNTLA